MKGKGDEDGEGDGKRSRGRRRRKVEARSEEACREREKKALRGGEVKRTAEMEGGGGGDT